jgi:hypothetical protein
MLADVRAVSSAADPFAIKPAQLPSMSGRPEMAAGIAAAMAAERGAAPSGGASFTAINDGDGKAVAYIEAGKGDKVIVKSYAVRFGRVAAGIVVVMLLMGGLAVAFTAGSTSGEWDPPYKDRLSQGRISLDIEPSAEAGANTLAQSMQVLPPVSLDRLPVTPPDGGAVATIGTVLVLDDLDAKQGEPLAAGMAVLCSRLRAAHWAVIGDLSDSALTSERDIELLAGARAAIGLSDPGDDEAVARLSDFLRDQDDSLDAILWVGQGDANEPVRSRAITRDEAVALELTSLLND